MKAFLAELKQLNPKTPWTWPMLIKLLALFGVLLGLIGAGYVGLWQDQWNTWTEAQKKEEDLKNSWLDKKKQAVNLDSYEQEKKDIEISFGALLKQLPNKSEMDALLTDINQAGLGRGLQFEDFKPAAAENFTEFYAELPVTLKITGNYHDIGAFASDIAALPRIVTLNDIAISATASGVLNMDATAKTYRYLDPDEVAKQKKAAKAPK